MSTNSNDTRERVISVRVSEGEFNKLKVKLDKTIYESMSEFVRRSALDQKIDVARSVIDLDTYKILRDIYLDLRGLVNKSVNKEPYLDDGIDTMIHIMHTISHINEDLMFMIENDRQAG